MLSRCTRKHGVSRRARAVAVVLLGCLVAHPSGLLGQSVRDSAGLRVVENRAPSWTSSKAWRFSAAPTLQIGAVEGDSTLLLNQTRYGARLADGRIVVAQSSQLRIFNATGAYLGTIGRRGRGPGEFGLGVSGVAVLPGDTIAVNQSRTVMLFDSRGGYARSFATIPPGLVRDHMSEGASLLPDGSALINLYEREPTEWKVGVIRPVQGYVRVVGGSARADTAGFFPGTEQVVVTGGARPEINIRPFGRRTIVTAGGGRFYVGDNATYEIRGYALEGLRPDLIIRRAAPPVAVTREDRSAWADRRRAAVATLPPSRRSIEAPMIEREIARAEFAKTKPAFGQLQADRLGNLWVRETSAPGKDTVFAVYDRTGRLLGEIAPPRGVTVLEIGADYMLGVWKNEDDVEFVRVYSLIKP